MTLIMAAVAALGLTINPAVCQEPCTVTATITVGVNAPEADVCIGLMEDNIITTQSCWPHSGRRRTTVTIKNVGAGRYEVFAMLRGHDMAVRRLRVISGGGSEQ